MSLVAFDTLKFSNQLRAGNFTPEQAQAMTDAMSDAMSGAELATKSDLVILEQRLERKIDGVKTELERKIDGVSAEVAAVKADIVALELRMTIKLGVMMMAMAGLIVAAIKYLPPGH